MIMHPRSADPEGVDPGKDPELPVVGHDQLVHVHVCELCKAHQIMGIVGQTPAAMVVTS